MSDRYYMFFIQHEWLVPAVADFTGMPISEVQTLWNAAAAKGELCTFKVKGDIPPHKHCKVCGTMARKDALWCKTCGTEYAAYP